MSHSIKLNVVSKDINIDLLRDKFNLLSPNLSRELSTHLDLSSISYIDRVEAQDDNPI